MHVRFIAIEKILLSEWGSPLRRFSYYNPRTPVAVPGLLSASGRVTLKI